MDKLSYKTISANKNTVVKEWILIDAEDQVLGRLASRVAMILRGKHKPSYTPHVDCGDNVIIINAEKIKLTGLKKDQKEYVRHSGYPGSQRFRTVNEMLVKDPTFILNNAIKGMLPKNALGRQLLRNLRIYAGTEHNHEAQEPKTIDLNTIK
ncbi:50S ribosomal protein L13 [Odoribacter sp. OttesenSCG-928-L07]|nr:50S ribosomal protein L13 [Odoribacter sp. OttesenSCG-928-L07]